MIEVENDSKRFPIESGETIMRSQLEQFASNEPGAGIQFKWCGDIPASS
jgi:hypothetical protein